MSLLLVKKLIAHSFDLFGGCGGEKIDWARFFIWPTSIWMLGINAFGRFLNVNLNSSAYKKGSPDRPIFLLLYPQSCTTIFLGSTISAWLNFIKVGWFEASILPNWICTIIIAISTECCNIPKEEMHSGPEAVEIIATRDRQYEVSNIFLHQMIIEEHQGFFS